MSEYPKIKGPYLRHPKDHNIMWGHWATDEFALLADHPWVWYEKVDGTNVRVIWDGHQVEFRGRTDRAIFPSHLLDKLQQLFPEEMLEQQFEDKQVVLYGEGFGPKIQKGGGLYGDEVDFCLFDVRVGQVWLRQDDVTEVAFEMGLTRAPRVAMWTPKVAVDKVRYWFIESAWPNVVPEGIIGRPLGEFLDRRGQRIIMKLKPENVGAENIFGEGAA